MWSHQMWGSSGTSSSTSQDQINSLQEQAQQYAAYAQQQGQSNQWQQQTDGGGSASSAANPWMWGQTGMYGMYGMYGDPSSTAAAAMSWMSVPPPSMGSATNTSVPPPNIATGDSGTPSAGTSSDAKPPSGPPPTAPPPPDDPPPPPPPDEDQDNANAGGYSTSTNRTSNQPDGGTQTEFDEANDEDLKEFDRQFANWEKQFTQWQEENKNHPDKSGLKKYEEDWNKWRNDLLQKREEMLKNKLEQFEEQKKSFKAPNGNSGSTKDTSDVTAAVSDSQKSDQDNQNPYGEGYNQSFNQSGYNMPPQGPPPIGPYGQFQGPPGFNQGPPGFNQGPGGRGGVGRGVFNEGRDQGDDKGLGRGSQNQGSRFDQGSEKDNYQGLGRGGFNQGSNRGGSNRSQGPDGFNADYEQGGNKGSQDSGELYDPFGSFGQGSDRDRFGSSPNRGSFNRGSSRGGFNQGLNRSALGPGLDSGRYSQDFDAASERDFGQGRGRGGFNQGSNRGFNEDSDSDRGMFDKETNRGGFNQGPNRGDFGFNQRGGFNRNQSGMNRDPDQGDFSAGPNRGGFSHGQGGFSQRDQFEDPDENSDFRMGRGGGINMGRGRGRGGHGGPDDFNPDLNNLRGLSQRGGFGQDLMNRGRGGFDGSSTDGLPSGTNRDGDVFDEPANRGVGERGGFMGQRGGFGRGDLNKQSFGTIGNNDGRNMGGFDQGGRGRGGFDGGRGGRGGFNQSRGFDAGDPDNNNFDPSSRGRGFNQGLRGRGGFDQGGRGGGFGRGGPTDNNNWLDENQEGMNWRNMDRWQNADQFGDGTRGRGNMRGRGFGPDRGRGCGRGGVPGSGWNTDNMDDKKMSSDWNKGNNPVWWASKTESVPPEFTGSLLDNKGGIPGLDVPPDAEKEKEKRIEKVEKKDSSKPSSLRESSSDDKIDVKLGNSKLCIGPIGVPYEGKFTLPGGWYDDDDENDKKDSDGKEGGSKTEDSKKADQPKDMKSQMELGGPRAYFGAPSSSNPELLDPPHGQGLLGTGPGQGLLGPGPGLGGPGFRGPPTGRGGPDGPPSRWSDNRMDRQGMGNRSGRDDSYSPAMGLSELCENIEKGAQDDRRRRPGWEEKDYDRQRDDPFDNRFGRDRWGHPDDRRGMPPYDEGRERGSFNRDDRDPYGRDDRELYGRDDREPYGREDRGPHARDERGLYNRDEWDQYDRDRDRGRGPHDNFGREMRDSFGRENMGDWYGMSSRDRPFDSSRRFSEEPFGRLPFSSDRYSLRGPQDRDLFREERDLYNRERRDFFDREDRPPIARESYSRDSSHRPAIVEYGHGSREGSDDTRGGQQFSDDMDLDKEGMEMMHAEIMRDRSVRMDREEKRAPSFLPNTRQGNLLQGRSDRDRSPVRPPLSSAPPKPGVRPPPRSAIENKEPEVVGETVTIDDLISVPGRFMRPPKLVIILRGPPGSGKTTMAKMIKDREVENGGSPPRILSLDDYFMVETEKMVTDPDSGRKVKTKIMEYEYEPDLEDSYRLSLVKSFKKQIDDGFFPFIIIDCVNPKIEHFSEIASYGKKNGFEVYVGNLEVDLTTCLQRNTHNHTKDHMQKIISTWELTPASYSKVDLTPLAQDAAIEEVEMEDSTEPEVKEGNADKGKSESGKQEEKKDDEMDEEEDDQGSFLKVYNEFIRSKWDTDESQEEKLDKLDGVRSAKKRMAAVQPTSIEDWLQLSKDYDSKVAEPGKKRVRWADFEERKKQSKARERGFVLGQTDWNRITDTTDGESALVQIRYIEGRESK